MSGNKNKTQPPAFRRKFLRLLEKYDGKKLAEKLQVDANYISRVKNNEEKVPSGLFQSAVDFLHEIEFPSSAQSRERVALVLHEIAEKYRTAKDSVASVGSDKVEDLLGTQPDTERKQGDASAS